MEQVGNTDSKDASSQELGEKWVQDVKRAVGADEYKRMKDSFDKDTYDYVKCHEDDIFDISLNSESRERWLNFFDVFSKF